MAGRLPEFDGDFSMSYDPNPEIQEMVREVVRRIHVEQEKALHDALKQLGWIPPSTTRTEWRVLDDKDVCYSGVRHDEEAARRYLAMDLANGLPARLQRRTVTAWEDEDAGT